MEQLVILYDNRAVEGFKADWGFSLLVELEEESILFDTGAKPEVLKHNMEAAGVDPAEIGRVFISHNHWDHTGGLPSIIEVNREFELYIPETDCYKIEEELPESVICVPVVAPTYITERALSTGVMPTGMEEPAEEQSLIVFSQMGAVLITGCSHPGIVDIAKKAVSLIGEELFLAVGGFHLYNFSDEEIKEVSEELKKFTRFVAPCHCTGERGIEIFKENWGDRFVEAMAGVEIPLTEE